MGGWGSSPTPAIHNLFLSRREVGIGIDGEGELGQKVGGLVDVVE
jgi:hypothetical protein